jgi:hypothetical protein
MTTGTGSGQAAKQPGGQAAGKNSGQLAESTKLRGHAEPRRGRGDSSIGRFVNWERRRAGKDVGDD